MLTNHMVLLGACWRNHPCIESLHAVFGGLYGCQILRNAGPGGEAKTYSAYLFHPDSAGSVHFGPFRYFIDIISGFQLGIGQWAHR